ncbi:hypothetical protein ACQKNC_13585 [Lysinibacillus sp. NPDC094177]|uniref:hypothetical protein n=1 Tax=Lysinibacillus sp. NPDC094177 TaxID=3390580 RepID=UPI003D07871C
MADYGLTATQVEHYGVVSRQLRIRWNATLPTGATLTVHRGGDGNRVFSKSYTKSKTSDDITIDVPWYGEFKVALTLNSPAIGSDVVYPTVKMRGTHTSPTVTYDAALVQKAKEGQAIVLLISVLAGSLRLIGSTISILLGSSVFSTETVSFPSVPRIGDKLDVITSAMPAGGAQITTTYTAVAYTDSYGNYQSSQKYTKLSYIAYVPWNFGK